MTKKEARTPEQFSADPAAIELLQRAQTLGIGTAFTRKAWRRAQSAVAACAARCA